MAHIAAPADKTLDPFLFVNLITLSNDQKYSFCFGALATIVFPRRLNVDEINMKNSIGALSSLVFATGAFAQDLTYTLYGTPGLIEMPTAQVAPDGQITASLTAFEQQQRASFSFQIAPRLSGTFRYAGISENQGVGTNGTFDRSFDLRYQAFEEGQFGDWSPAVAIGLQDFMGTGHLTSEYVVASKSFGDKIIATTGLGWGRMGTQGGFTNPLAIFGDSFETRPTGGIGRGGKPSIDKFFKGDAAFFGGITYQYSDNLTLKAEYSSDAYTRKTDNGTIDVRTPVNVGLSYQWKPNVTLDAAYLYGSEVAAGVTFDLNPRKRALVSGTETAPVPVRQTGAARDVLASWGVSDTSTLEQTLSAGLDSDGIRLNGLDVSGDTARVRYTNGQFRSEAQAMGRVARILTQALPDTVTRFVLEPQQSGIALSAITLNRSDLESLENTATAADDLLARATITDAGNSMALPAAEAPPAFTWGITPYAALILFNGNAPVQIDLGLQARGTYELSPNLVINGSIRQSALGQRDLANVTDHINSYHNVRTDGPKYGADGGPVITDLTLTHFSRPGKDLYGRVTVGYLEEMYGGVSGELLWKPVDSRLAVGAELNYARQRDFDMLLGFQDYETVAGYLTGYYSFDNGFHAQLSAGRYLAGDWGATFALDREFDNGWKVGAYFTLTDMPFDEFGEGSFDKGIRITVPTDFFFENASRRTVSTKLASLSRDGGAKLEIDDRLYDIVRSGHVAGPMGDTWGRVWR